jgi:hypothetical protein
MVASTRDLGSNGVDILTAHKPLNHPEVRRSLRSEMGTIMARTVRPGARRHAVGMGTALAVLAVGLGACSSVASLGDKIGDSLPPAVGGLPSDVPARSATQPDFVPVGNTPPPRELKTLTEDERKKLEADLKTLRDRQEGKTSGPKEKRTPGPAASAKVTDEAANR